MTSTYLTDAPAVGVQMNKNFTPVAMGTPSEGANQGTRDSKKRCIDGSDPKNTITELLGDVQLTNVGSRNLDLVAGYPHATTGIPYAIQGSAKVISVNVGEYLASFSDPLKAILSTNIHKESRVIISRKYVVGGKAMVVPEHAPARTVSIQEDVREVALTRFGGDIEMNLNLFLRPQEAKEELSMKVEAQRRELERVLISMGYDMLLTQGTDLVDAIIRSSPLFSAQHGTINAEVLDGAERINVQSVFGAMSKYSYPVQNLLAAARYASSYTTSNSKGSVLLLPHGLPDIMRFTRQEGMLYDIAGPALLQQTNGEKISMKIEQAWTDNATGTVRILIHRQMPTFEAGVANPDVGPGSLTSEAAFGNFYVPNEDNNYYVTDFENGATRKVTQANGNTWDTAFDEGGGNDWKDVLNDDGWADLDTPSVAALAGRVETTPKARAFVAHVFYGAACDALAGGGAPDLQVLARAINDARDNVNFKALSDAADAQIDAALARGGGYQRLLVRPKIIALMSSGILAAPGEETGSLLVGYPFTSVSTSSQEIVKIQMRTYLGSVLRKPENVLILRNIYFEGLKSGHRFRKVNSLAAAVQNDDVDLAEISIPKQYFDAHNTCLSFSHFEEGADPKDTLGVGCTDDQVRFFRFQLQALGIFSTDNRLVCSDPDEEPGFPARLYRGTTYDATEDKIVRHNTGHMGTLDDYRHTARLYGATSHVYNSSPDPRNTAR